MKSPRALLVSRTILASLAISLALGACSEKVSPEAAVAKAKVHLAEHDNRAAIIDLKNALQSKPDLGEARLLLGKTLLAEGDPRSAEVELRKALALGFDANQTIPELARAALAQNHTDQLITEFKAQTLSAPEAKADLLTTIGLAYYATSKPDDAQRSFTAAEQAVPNYPRALLGQARLLASNQNLAGAETLVSEVLKTSPTMVEALLLNGDFDRADNHPDQAELAYQTAAKEQPRMFAPHLALARLDVSQRKFADAHTQIDLLKKIAPRSADLAYVEAVLLYDEKSYAPANEAIERALVAMPDSTQVLTLAGAIELALNQTAQSETHLLRVIQKQPDDDYARKLLGTLYLHNQQPLKAGDVLQPALATSPNDPGLLALAGEVALARGDYDHASQYFDSAAKINPSNVRVRTQSAMIDIAKGNSQRGFSELEAAAHADPENPAPDQILVATHLHRKEYELAETSWKMLVKQRPNDPLTYNLQAGILLGKNDLPGARSALEHALELNPTYFPSAANLAALDLRDKNVDAAKGRFRSVLDKDKNNLAALLALAHLEQTTGAPAKDVEALLVQARRGNPSSTQPVVALAQYYVGMGNTSQALATTKDALVASPGNPELLDLLGQVQTRSGDRAAALETYSSLAAAHPQSVAAQLRLAEAQVSSGNTQAAITTYGKVLTLNPDSVAAQVASVNLMLRLGKSADAMKLVEQIQRRTPDSPVALQLAGDIQLYDHQYPAALAAFKKALEISPSTGLMIQSYQATLQAGQKTQADAILNKWLKAHPDDVEAHLFSADRAMHAHDYADASAQYRSVLAAQPDNVPALNNLAWVALDMKDPKALEYAQKAYSIAPQSPAVADTLGWVMTEQGQVKPGLDLLEKAAKDAPKQLDIRLHLAKAQIKAGNKDAARGELQAIVKDGAGSAEAKESAQLLTTL